MTFAELTSFLLAAVQRPSTFSSTVKLCINQAISQATKMNQFSYTKDVATITYTANSETVSWTSLIPTASSISGVALVGTNGSLIRVLQVVSYDKIFTEFRPMATQLLGTDYQPASDIVNTETQTELRKAFLLGENLGIWPKPATDILLKVLFYKKVEPLVNDSDTNFLTENCDTLVIDLALQRLNYFLKEDERFQITEAQIKRSLVAAQQWDSGVLSNNGIDWN